MDNAPTLGECDALVLDRNPIHRHLLRALLEQKGYRVASACELPDISHRIALIDIDECRDVAEQIAQVRPGVFSIGLVSREEYAQPCLDAGATATLIRPVHADQLFALLQNLFPSNANPETPPIDVQGIVARVGGRMQILEKMVAIFSKELPGQIAALHRAIDRQSPEDLRQAAHALKGAVANFDARTAHQTTAALEQMGKAGHLRDARTTCRQLERELSAVQNALEEFISSL